MLTTFFSSNVWQFELSHKAHPVEILYPLYGHHALHASQWNTRSLHHAFPLQHYPPVVQAHLITITSSNATSHGMNEFPV
jgi:hypothetical protein